MGDLLVKSQNQARQQSRLLSFNHPSGLCKIEIRPRKIATNDIIRQYNILNSITSSLPFKEKDVEYFFFGSNYCGCMAVTNKRHPIVILLFGYTYSITGILLPLCTTVPYQLIEHTTSGERNDNISDYFLCCIIITNFVYLTDKIRIRHSFPVIMLCHFTYS